MIKPPGLEVAAQQLADMEIAVPQARIQSVLEKLDFQEFTQELQSRWEMTEWDRVEPINGVEASVILDERKDIVPGGQIYLVKVDGEVVIFQPHDPESNQKNDIKKAEKLFEKVVTDKCHVAYLNEVYKRLLPFDREDLGPEPSWP